MYRICRVTTLLPLSNMLYGLASTFFVIMYYFSSARTNGTILRIVTSLLLPLKMSPAVVVVSQLLLPPPIIITAVVMPDDDDDTPPALLWLIGFVLGDAFLAFLHHYHYQHRYYCFCCRHITQIQTQANRHTLRSSSRTIYASAVFVDLRAYLCVYKETDPGSFIYYCDSDCELVRDGKSVREGSSVSCGMPFGLPVFLI